MDETTEQKEGARAIPPAPSLFVETTNITAAVRPDGTLPNRTYDPVGLLWLTELAPRATGHLTLPHDDPKLMQVRAAMAMGLPLWVALPGVVGAMTPMTITGIWGRSGDVRVDLEVQP